MTRRHYKLLKEAEYKQIRALLDANISRRKVSEVSGRSESTVIYISRSQNFQDYKRILQEVNSKKPKVVTAKEEPVEYHTTNGTLPKILTTLQEINGTLQKLEKLWEYKPRKSSWF